MKKEPKMVVFNIKKEINITEFASEVFKNFPEHAISLECHNYNYEKMQFSFYDYDEDEMYNLTRSKIENGVEKFINQYLDGMYPGFDLNQKLDIFNLYKWDGYITDGCMQVCIFGEIIYG